MLIALFVFLREQANPELFQKLYQTAQKSTITLARYNVIILYSSLHTSYDLVVLLLKKSMLFFLVGKTTKTKNFRLKKITIITIEKP